MNRRVFGKLTATATAAAAITLPDNHSRIGMTDVEQLLADVDALGEIDQRTGGAALAGFAAARLHEVKERLETGVFDSRSGKAFTRAAGELAVLAGWLAYDADQQSLARRCYADAMALGAEVSDAELIAHTCLYSANQACFLVRHAKGGSPYKALQLTGRARDLMQGRSPGRIHALIAIRDAQAYGLLGDGAAFGRAIATAWRELEHAEQFEPLDEVPQWLRFVTASEVADHEARGYADIGDLYRSVRLYAVAVEHPAQTRNATIVRAWSAAMRARLGDITGALEHGMPALRGLSELSSTRTLRRLEPVRTAVAKSPAGVEFRDLYDRLELKAITA